MGTVVTVMNDNEYPYHEKFRGMEIHIPAKASIKMDVNDAHLFLGTRPNNIEVDGNGLQKPETYKKLRILEYQPITLPKHACNACGKDMITKEAYEAHVAEEHVELLADEETKEKVVAKKRGRPAKVVTANDASAD